MKCKNHPTENAWYYLLLQGDEENAQLKIMLCLACSESCRDRGMQEQLYEIPYGAEHKARGL